MRAPAGAAGRGAPLLAALLLLCAGGRPAAATHTLIVEYAPNAVSAAATAAAGGGGGDGSVAIAAAQASAAAVAVAAATARGADGARAAAVGELAGAAAAVLPGLDALTTSVAVAATSSGIRVLGHTRYATVLHGAAIRTAGPADAARLRAQLEANPAVAHVWEAGARQLVRPVRPANLTAAGAPPRGGAARPADAGAAPARATDGNSAATGLARVAAAPGGDRLDGTGTLVCIVDTGINYRLPLYGSCTAINQPSSCRVVAGLDLVGDKYNGQTDGPPPTAGNEPLDCMGHGSMVASVAATANGVAPGAALGSYRVFGCDGFAGDDVIIAAIDAAVRDGCDVINLSLASGSGYAERSVYSPVMAAALGAGVLVVKAAGNSGADGPFTADAFTAAGAVSVASVGDDAVGLPLDDALVASGFSSFGPNPSLRLGPHVSAPGSYVPVITMWGGPYRASGTSFASPYIAGVLALGLQAARLSPPARLRQAGALQALVSTAAGVPTRARSDVEEPVAKVGAGVVQVDAFLANPVAVTPTSLALPSALDSPFTARLRLRWAGPARGRGGTVAYRLAFAPGAATGVANGWFGSDASIAYDWAAPQAAFEPPVISLNATPGATAEAQVTFTLPRELAGRPLLYSGAVRLLPSESGLAPLRVPVQGFGGDWAGMRLLARAGAAPDEPLLAAQLEAQANALCYAPGTAPRVAGAIMDTLSAVPAVCAGGFAARAGDVLRVSLAELRAAPECALRVTLVPEAPLHTLFLELLDADGRLLGALAPLDTSSGSALATARSVPSFCTHFNGTYADTTGAPASVQAGRTYALRAGLRGPLAAGDRALGRTPQRSRVAIRGSFRVQA
ncbi:subtilisin-like serine protease [Scenedesmus sp. PABB004]|nr:subtilisin-like serine protease [Scenedesmus sp. PABB004]